MEVNKKGKDHFSPPTEKLIILLAEEHPLTAKIEKKSLEESGFETILVHSMAEILVQVENTKIDILMIDMNFQWDSSPKHNSISKIKQISLSSEIKIILTSVVPIEKKVSKTLIKMIDLTMIKPMTKNKMVQEIKKLFSLEIRKNHRMMSELKATIVCENRIFRNKMIDISENGFHLDDKNDLLKLNIGSVLKIKLEVPNYQNPMVIMAIVVRKSEQGYGIKITDISLENRMIISKYIQKNCPIKRKEIFYF